MKAFKSFFLLSILILAIFALIQAGCGGGGGGSSDNGGGSAPTLTSTNASQATGAVIQAANLVGASSELGGGVQPASASSGARAYSKPPLVRLLDKVVSLSKEQKHKTGLHTAGSLPPETGSCSDGGSATVSAAWTGPDNPSDPSQIVDLQATFNFSSCKEGTETFNGGLTVKFEGPLSSFSKMTITAANLSFSDSATSDSITMRNLTMTFSNFIFSGTELTSATIVITGSISGNVEGKEVNVQCDGYTMTFSSNASGTTVSISGKIKPVCLKGFVTITTNTSLFIPKNATCPTAGDIVATAGDETVRVVVASDSKITVYFNDAVVQTYNSCQDVDGLCVG